MNKLIELNDELENYFRNTIIPQLFVDAHLILRKLTPPAMKQFKLHSSDVGRPISEIKDNFRFPAIVDIIQHVIDTGEVLEKEIQTTDLRWYQINIIPYLVQKGNKTNGVIITFVEITMRIKDLRDQEKLIAEHEMLLDTIAHDMKNPLTALKLTIQLLKKLPVNKMEIFPALVANIEKSSLSMQNVISDLTKSRWQQHRYQAVEELLNIEHIIDDVRLALAPQIEETKAIIKYEIGVSEIMFMRRKLLSLIYNLLNNAIKYKSANRRPEILIRTTEENGFLLITVRDNGIGIADKDLNKVFSKYHRVNPAIEGTGIGLYLVKEIATSTGGHILVESKLGEGSTFKVSLGAPQGKN